MDSPSNEIPGVQTPRRRYFRPPPATPATLDKRRCVTCRTRWAQPGTQLCLTCRLLAVEALEGQQPLPAPTPTDAPAVTPHTPRTVRLWEPGVGYRDFESIWTGKETPLDAITRARENA